MLSVLAATTAGVLGSEDARDYIRVDGQRLVAGAGREFHIRGMGSGSTSSDPLEKDYEEIARLKFNAVTVSLSYNRFYTQRSRKSTTARVGNEWTSMLRWLASTGCASSCKC